MNTAVIGAIKSQSPCTQSIERREPVQNVVRTLFAEPDCNASRENHLAAFGRLQQAYLLGCSQAQSASLLVVRITNLSSTMFELLGPALRLQVQQDLVAQLQKIGGHGTYVAAVGHDEYAILLLGIDRCTDLIHRVEKLLARARAGRLNGDGRELHCRVGIARAGIDAQNLPELLHMASQAALEPIPSPSFEFVNQRHQLNS